MIERMYYRKRKTFVDVYAYNPEKKLALIFDPATAPAYWETVKISQLLPPEYINKEDGSYQSKTRKNKIKSHLKLVAATWECEDGLQFDHAHLDDAIDHQGALMNLSPEDEEVIESQQ